MRYKAKLAAPLFTLAIIAAGIPAVQASANPAADEISAVIDLSSDGLVFDSDGSVVEGDAPTVTEEWFEPNPDAPAGDVFMMACPEVNDPAKVTLKGTPKFVIDEAEPFSSWLQPGQSAKYSTETAHEIGADVEVGGESEVGAVIAKAKVSLKIKIAEKNSVKRNLEVADKNDTKKAYRVRLGSMGWKVTRTKSWIAPPCTAKKQITYVVNAPQPGDISLGRFNC